MPTDKPYTVEVRIKQHDRPTRRVPPAGTETGEAAIVIVIDGDEAIPENTTFAGTQRDGVDIRDTSNGIAMWLGLGVHLAERTENEFERFFFSTVLGIAHSIAQNPEEAIAFQQIAGLVGSMVEKAGEAVVVEEAKKSSTEGLN